MNNIQQVIDTLDLWGKVAHDDAFIERFCPTAWVLTEVAWNAHQMRFVYILDSGQHVSDSVEIAEWLKFLEETK